MSVFFFRVFGSVVGLFGHLLGFFGYRLRHPYRFQFLYPVHLEGSQTLSLRLEALHADEVTRLDDERLAETVVPAEYDLQPGIYLAGEQNQPVVLVLAQVILPLGGILEREAFQVRIVLLVGVVQGGGPDLVGIELLDNLYIGVVVVVQVEVRGVELAVLVDYQDGVVALELAQVLARPS